MRKFVPILLHLSPNKITPCDNHPQGDFKAISILGPLLGYVVMIMSITTHQTKETTSGLIIFTSLTVNDLFKIIEEAKINDPVPPITNSRPTMSSIAPYLS